MSDSLRLFVGLRLSLAAVRAIDEVVAGLRAGARASGLALRWVPPASYHVTLKFLGACRPEVVTALRDRIDRELEGARRLELRTAGLGGFPSLDKARVLWAGLDDAGGRVAELAARVERATTDLGFAAERRGFHPHVTLARLAQASDLRSLVQSAPERVRSETRADSLVLFESVTKPDGSEYLERASWPLESASRGQKRQTRPVELAPEHDGAEPHDDPTWARGGREEHDHGDQGDDVESGD